uniref:Uncharacterized protein n=1 Tax=Moorena producens (strain JHB) TaxID=1454205 RepID=A0A1D9G9J4_MOOP1
MRYSLLPVPRSAVPRSAVPFAIVESVSNYPLPISLNHSKIGQRQFFSLFWFFSQDCYLVRI